MDKEKTYLCRCENLTLEDLYKLLDAGITSMQEIKRESRYTMGPCQGRTCREIIAKEIAKYQEIHLSEVDMPAYRAPVKPMKLGIIAGGGENA